MAARGRPRAGAKDEIATHEERDLWSKIVTDVKDLMKQSKRIEDLAQDIQDENARLEDLDSPAPRDFQTLERLLKEQKDAAEAEQGMLSKALERNDLLIALRTATEGGDRGGVPPRDRAKRKHTDLPSHPSHDPLSTPADSPSSTSHPRHPKLPRSSSTAPTETLHIRDEVAYRLPKQKGAEGEWIQCIVTGIIGGEGGKRRYEVQDPEPDEAGGHGKYKANAGSLILIPKESAGLPVYPVGKQVLARYPETTTFYRAEVMGTKRDGTCRLRFEGEEEVGKETEVERRLVLDMGDKR